jgi:hypothetical protein
VNIKIPDKDYLIKKNYKSLLLFEQETGRSITELKQNLTDLMLLFYCIVKANNSIEFTYEQFVDLLDERPEAMDEFNKYLIDSATLVSEPQVKKKKVDNSK